MRNVAEWTEETGAGGLGRSPRSRAGTERGAIPLEMVASSAKRLPREGSAPHASDY